MNSDHVARSFRLVQSVNVSFVSLHASVDRLKALCLSLKNSGKTVPIGPDLDRLIDLVNIVSQEAQSASNQTNEAEIYLRDLFVRL